MELVIDRKRWLTGNSVDPNGDNESYLYRESDGKMCCLGFYARALGCTLDEVANVSSPNELVCNLPDTWELEDAPDKWLYKRTSDSSLGDFNATAKANSLMRINDKPSLNEELRERRIKKIFASEGVKVKFVGKKTTV